MVNATKRDGAVEGLVRELYGLGEVRRALGRHALAGLGTPGFVALAAVHAHGPLRVSDVAHRLAVDVSVVSRQIAALCAAGYASREPDPSDGRAQQIVVTEAGRAVLDASHGRMVEVFVRALGGWSTQEVDGLSRALARLREAFAAMDSHPVVAPGRDRRRGRAAATSGRGVAW